MTAPGWIEPACSALTDLIDRNPPPDTACFNAAVEGFQRIDEFTFDAAMRSLGMLVSPVINEIVRENMIRDLHSLADGGTCECPITLRTRLKALALFSAS